MAAHPCEQVPIATAGGGELGRGQEPTDRVDHRRNVDVFVRVHPASHRAWLPCVNVVMPPLLFSVAGGTHVREDGQDSDGASRTGASSVTTPDRDVHRTAGSLNRSTGHFQGTIVGPAVRRVRPEERAPAQSLAGPSRHPHHHCRSVAVSTRRTLADTAAGDLDPFRTSATASLVPFWCRHLRREPKHLSGQVRQRCVPDRFARSFDASEPR